MRGPCRPAFPAHRCGAYSCIRRAGRGKTDRGGDAKGGMAAPTRNDRSPDLDVVVLACALSAGVHAGLVPEHMHESPLLGVSFVVAAVLAALLAFALPRVGGSVLLPAAAAVLLGGLIVAYGLSRVNGLPLLG